MGAGGSCCTSLSEGADFCPTSVQRRASHAARQGEDAGAATVQFDLEVEAEAAAIEVVAAGGAGGHRAEAAGVEDAVRDPLGESLAEQRITQVGGLRRLPGMP